MAGLDAGEYEKGPSRYNTLLCQTSTFLVHYSLVVARWLNKNVDIEYTSIYVH